jgi:hypothetical protein
MAGRWWQALFAATAGGSLELAGRRPWVLAAKLTVVPPFHACATGRPASSEARTNVRLRYYSYATSLLSTSTNILPLHTCCLSDLRANGCIK